MMTKKILFLTGTRADFGKLKSLIISVNEQQEFEPVIFITGMHMLSKYGMTSIEVERLGIPSTYKYINQNEYDSMDVILAKTISGLSDYVREVKPDMIVVHGDRVEAMAGAIVGSLNNILVAHIEGGEVSGTIDELIRHSISKMAHIHFVSNEEARTRLIQMGELEESIYVIGSPDLDVMSSASLPTLEQAKDKYEIAFDDYAMFMYHPVTTDLDSLDENVSNTLEAMKESGQNYIIIYPNNDHGSDIILERITELRGNPRFRIYPSLRFEYFLTLLKNASFMIGNSSAGVREAPFYGVPSINLGSRQNNRAKSESIFNIRENKNDILDAITAAGRAQFDPTMEFGNGNSSEQFLGALMTDAIWQTSKQKLFVDALRKK